MSANSRGKSRYKYFFTFGADYEGHKQKHDLARSCLSYLPQILEFFDSLWSLRAFHKMLFYLQCYCISCSVFEYKFSSFSNLKR